MCNRLVRTDNALIPEDARVYFRDVYDHLIRISDLIDTYRDLLTSSMDVYLSTVSNRLGSVTKQLTIIATIFLPLSWITGFFGQNFEHLPFRSDALMYSMIATCALIPTAMVLLFKRSGWF